MKIFTSEPLKHQLRNILFLLFLIIYSVALVYLAYKINISEDESYSLNTTSGGLMRVIRQSYRFEGQPPVYFILLYFWRVVNSGLFFAKLLSIIFTGFSAYVLYRVISMFSGTTASRWMVIIFLLNPFTVWTALEIRTYSLLILLSLIAIYFFYRYFLGNKNKFLYLFVIVSLVGVYTQYFFALLTATFALSILIYKGWKPFWKFCMFQIPVVLLFLPNLIYLPDQIFMHEVNKSNFSVLSNISEVLHTPQNLMLGIDVIGSVFAKRSARIIFIILLLLAYWKLTKSERRFSNQSLRKINVIILNVIILLILFCVGIIVTGIIFMDKYMAVAFPFFLLVFGLFNVYPSFWKNAIYGSISAYFFILLAITYSHPVKTYDFISVAKYIEQKELPNEPILIYRPALALPFMHYYKGGNNIFPLPYPVNFDSSYLINIKDTTMLRRAIENIKSKSNSYLFISDTSSYESTLKMNRQMVTDFLESNYAISLDTFYTGFSKNRPLRIRRFVKK